MNKYLQFDLGRGRVPRPETVSAMLDRLVPHGLTGILFYLEFCAENTAFPVTGTGKTLVSGEYLDTIREICDRHHVDFMPHFEIYSHAENLLSLPEMQKYAAEEKSHIFRFDLPELREKIKQHIKEVSSHFSSQYIHCGGDEPFQLGYGPYNGEFFRKHGFEKAFTDYVNEFNRFVRGLGKTMLYYADVPIVYPGMTDLLDDDIVMVNWAYCGKHECFEDENYHFSRHDIGIGKHRFMGCGNCMAEYVFTPFERLMENTDIWRKLGKKAEGFIISDWGCSINPYTLTTLGTLYALHRYDSADYSKEDFLRDADEMILKRSSSVFREAYSTLLHVADGVNWGPRNAYDGPKLESLLMADPDNRRISYLFGAIPEGSLDRMVQNVRIAADQLKTVPLSDAKAPDMLEDLQYLAERVYVALLRGKLCRLHAEDGGGIWFTDEVLQPIRDLYDDCMRRMKDDYAFLIRNWDRDSLESRRAHAEELYRKAMDTTIHAVRLPKNLLRAFPPKPLPLDQLTDWK